MNDRHAGDSVLASVTRHFPEIYAAPQQQAEMRLTAFLRAKLAALQPTEGESPTEYRARLLRAFSGPRWLLTRRMIAQAFTDANSEAMERINAALAGAFAAGFNESAYSMALTGAQTVPITAAIVSALAAAQIIVLNKSRIKKGKDIAYNEQRLQSAVRAAILQDVKPGDIPREAARHMAKARQNEILSTASTNIYSASDSGAFIAGVEAEREGLDIEKTWLAIMDMNVRASHKHLHGTTIPLHEKFHGFHGVLRYPHDPDAPFAEICRCRCRMVVHLAGKSPGEYSRRLLPTETAAYQSWRAAQIRRLGGEVELEKLHRRQIKGA